MPNAKTGFFCLFPGFSKSPRRLLKFWVSPGHCPALLSSSLLLVKLLCAETPACPRHTTHSKQSIRPEAPPHVPVSAM